ncbi:lytic transglycosylase domain-containing protein [Caldalkalibacillus mannanilyticus]|uniref:lytic transglycosylase domain-containing protein n=1 Tax=Caldalkalibacillus mannanilyticus TaxID=1418 RepID=UPI00046AA74F|nr:lytic transglycosylase domain-containing protein [Caldalkalibacillus mannanilyticus]
MKLSLKHVVYLISIFALFILLNSPFFWKMMYPIQFESEVKDAADYFEVSPYLVLAVMQTESRFNHDRLSKKGATGLMQLMPETAKWANKESGLHKDPNSYIDDPKSNILLGSWYLSYLINKYDQDELKAIVAYNAGQGHVDRWIESGIWDGTEYRIDQIPFGETRHYVARVLYFKKRYEEIYRDQFN